MCSIKTEQEECNVDTEILTEQFNWQLTQISSGEGIKLEQDMSTVWHNSATMSNWQMSKEQPDTSYDKAEYPTSYDLDVDDSVLNRNFAPIQRAGKRSNDIERISTRKKRQMTSETKLPEIFRFFCNVEKDCNAKPGAISATCNACQTRIKGFITVTSNFIKHLRLKHFEIHAAFISAKQVGNSEVPELSESDSFDNRVMCYVIDTAIPLSTVETASFRNLFKGTNLQVLSRSKLEHRLDERYSKMCYSLINMIRDVKYVCATADIWTTKQCSLFSYTCHWLDQKYQRNSVVLSCKRFSGENYQILEMINNVNTKFDLNNLKIVATVTHYGTNFSKALKEFRLVRSFNNVDPSFQCDTDGEGVLKSIEEHCNLLPNHIKCASYTLNNLASTDFIELLINDTALKERHTKVFEKCSCLWRKSDNSTTSETIVTVLGESLITPVATRWNSIYNAICCILSHKEKLPELCSRLALHNSCFSASDIQYMEEYRVLMAPIVATIEFLQMESNLFYGCLIPALTSLCVKLKRVSDSTELIDLKNLATALQDKLKERFSKYFKLSEEANSAIIASVLCPSVKMRWFNALVKVYTHGRCADDIHKIVITEAVRHAKASENNHQYSIEQVLPKKKDDFYEFDEFDDAGETSDLDTSQPSPIAPTSKLTEEVESQFHNYLRNSGTNFDMLEKYPLLHDLAIKHNTILTSSAPVERLFSFEKIVSYLKNPELSDYPFEKLVLLKANCNV
ncbi:uncharacterized protein LOC117779708 isoform X2 [Drosophila innubila]|nr:uncharacterized protein LOC117779708 isoform X2 [Drosophila innubila]